MAKLLVTKSSPDARYIGTFDIVYRADKTYRISGAHLCYDPAPPNEDHHNFFAYFKNDLGRISVTGMKSFDGTMSGLFYKSKKELLISSFGHDMIFSEDGKVFVDGGMEYSRYGGKYMAEIEVVTLDLTNMTFKDKEDIQYAITI